MSEKPIRTPGIDGPDPRDLVGAEEAATDFDLDRSLRPGLSVLLVLLLIGACLGPWAEDYRFDPTVFPVTALESDFDTSGNVLNEMAWGGYLLLERPDIPVFIDGQTDFYGEELSRDYLAAIKARQGWREVLDTYDIAWTFTRRWEPINQLLALDPDWRRAYEDDVAVVYLSLIHI